MAQAKGVYAPLHVTSYGRLTPMSVTSGSAPKYAGGFGGLGGAALKGLGGLIDQSMESRQAGKKEQVAQLEMEMKEMNKLFEGGEFRTFEGADPMQQAERWHWNESYRGDRTFTPDISFIDRFFAIKGQLGQLKGQTQYKDRKPSAFDYQFTETAKPASTGIFGNAFRSIMGI